MVSTEFEEKIDRIKTTLNAEEITPRELFNAFGCERRTKNNCAYVDAYLENNKLETSPFYNDVYIDFKISLKPKETATTKSESDPIKKLHLLRSATSKPETVSPDTDLVTAITKMLSHGVCSLPVVTTPKTIKGYISWESIAYVYYQGKTPSNVSECMRTDFVVLSSETPILDAIKSIDKNGFILVKDTQETLCGSGTILDIWEELGKVTEPFMIIEEIEKNIRHLLSKSFLPEEIKNIIERTKEQNKVSEVQAQNNCKDDSSTVNCDILDDLTFGDYIRIIADETNWEKINITANRQEVVLTLEKVRSIRNSIMHFDPDGSNPEDYKILKQASRFIARLRELKH